MREAGFADSRLARDQHDPAVPVHLHATPGGTKPLELGTAPDELRLVPAGEDGRRRDVRRFSAAEIVDQRARFARGRNPELRAQPLGELPSGGQRRGAIAARRQPLDQPAIGRLRQRV